MKKKLLSLLLIGAMIFALTACGGGGSDEGAAEGEADGGDAVEETVEGKTFYVGTNPDFPPFEYTDEATGDITGFDYDLMEAIAADQGFTLEWTVLGFDALVPAVQTGNIDIAASGISITDERKEMAAFSDPYINAGLSIAVAAGNTEIAGEADLQGKTAAVQIGTTGAAKAQEYLDAGVLEDVVVLNTVDLVMQELVNGGVDCVINDLPVTQAYMAKQTGKIEVVGEPLVSDDYGFAVGKDNTVLLDAINAGLANVIADGTFDEIVAKYF